jgi:hypothetical protein
LLLLHDIAHCALVVLRIHQLAAQPLPVIERHANLVDDRRAVVFPEQDHGRRHVVLDAHPVIR